LARLKNKSNLLGQTSRQLMGDNIPVGSVSVQPLT